MKTTLLIALVMGILSPAPTWSAERGAMLPPSRTVCNQQATAAQITGDARKVYIRNCLQNRQSAPRDKSLTPYEQQMKKCSAQTQMLDGDERRRASGDCMAQSGW